MHISKELTCSWRDLVGFFVCLLRLYFCLFVRNGILLCYPGCPKPLGSRHLAVSTSGVTWTTGTQHPSSLEVLPIASMYLLVIDKQGSSSYYGCV